MELSTWLPILNDVFVLIYGLFLSVDLAGSWENTRQKRLVFALCPLFLLVQALCFLQGGTAMVQALYPLITHLPLVLILVLALKKPLGVALVSVCTAYLCCQLPRWVNLLITALTGSALFGEVGYLLVIAPIWFLLHRYFARFSYAAMTYSTQTLLLFGSLPFVYYVFDYATVIYSDALYAGIPALTEFFPTAFCVFYVLFLAAYHAQTRRRTEAELQQSMLARELQQAGTELENLRRVETQTAVYQHNMRHHLNAIGGFLSADKPAQAIEYIQKVQADIAAITPRRFCENELVNLLCSSFVQKAEQKGVRLTIDAKLPRQLPFSDTAFCSLLSNGLENALQAASVLDDSLRWAEMRCSVRAGKLLLEIRNPYAGTVELRDGLPVSHRTGHGYGCRSIRSIAEQYGGLCAFAADSGIFTLQVVLPMPNLR